MDPTSPDLALGFAIGRSVGGAVVRNRLRRRVREVIWRLRRSGQLGAGRLLVICRADGCEVGPSELDGVICGLLARTGSLT
jgi:ribonuclease P protein component